MNTEYFESVEVSDVGRKRKNNEDACLRIPERGVYCVADGMGGQAGGDLASEAITTSIQQLFAKAAPEEDATFSRRIALFRKATDQANKWIKNFSDEKVIGQMGSTVVALIIDPRNPRRAAALHAGDSRLYRYRKGELKQLTADHSAIAALAAKLGCSPESIPAKYQNELLRAVGLTESIELEKTPVEVISGDVYLLCSDGLDKMQTNDQIAKILKDGASQPLATVAQTLINAANEAGGKDNVTVVLVKVGDISGVPNVMDADEEKEDITPAVPATPPPAEAPTPANYTPQVPAMPDTADVHGETPSTPHTENVTPDKDTETPIPAPTPKVSLEISAAKGEIGAVVKTVNESEKKKGHLSGIIIVAAVALAAGAGIWFAVSSKPKAAKPAANIRGAPSQPAVVTIAPVKPASQSPAVNPEAERSKAEIQEAGREALKKAQSAFDSHDYSNAMMWAATALQKIPSDAAAAKLQADTLAQIKIQDAWREALNNAQAAFDKRDYKNAEAWAAEALKKIPNEQAATKLRDSALQQISAGEELGRKYQAALQEGQDAFKKGDFSLAEKKAEEALNIRPNDPAATQIIKQSHVAMDLESARRFFGQGDYDTATQICQSHPGIDDFKQLAANCRTEQSALADAKNLFNAGHYSDYSFAARIQGQTFARKPPFIELLNQVAGEQKLLADLEPLKQSGNWQAVAGSLAGPAYAAVTNKAPFRSLDQWVQSQAEQVEKQKAQQQMTATFEVLLVRFNIKKPTDPYITTAEAKKEVRLDGSLSDPDRQRYLGIITSLETGFGKPSTPIQNDRAKLLKELKDTVIHHE
jgi:serine/threonine protein phosphatase PrpC/tetratricopeptide (TPR) repeat protein